MHGLFRDVQKSILRASVPFVLEYLFDDDENELLSPSVTGTVVFLSHFSVKQLHHHIVS